MGSLRYGHVQGGAGRWLRAPQYGFVVGQCAKSIYRACEHMFAHLQARHGSGTPCLIMLTKRCCCCSEYEAKNVGWYPQPWG